ncbi:MAG: protease [Ignavibacteria bacterium GWB2_35_12]|nr:MAG: protease [Ignavibacteria bacterium GWA2_35_8]OGU41203.1 MAG: protease [Ignavibacteria bacterium GWB2_35_12]OGU86790.1 MAG: protease [Ignavibacteria bacterium RIFOXYA2_FULL_35_10]OGV23126.1 MAG: protease [Ignavibacteria bacterium RIFOXYC2_FULL_35_21]
MKRATALVFLFSFLFAYTLSAGEGRILRFPNISETQITFAHGGDIYVVSKSGGLARKITNSEGLELFPRFSPDGTQIAFIGEYDGNREVYVVPNTGGEPKRITYSMDIPGVADRMGPDKIIMQWSKDGQKILYRSRHEMWNAMLGKLYFASMNGGLPEEVPLPRSGFASLSPDGSKIAYNRVFREFRPWKRYRGGQADDIWIYDFNTKKVENISNNPGQDIIPMWYKDKIYYTSDRDKRLNLFVYDLNTKQTKKLTNFDKYDCKFPSLGAGQIVFENGGYIYLMDLVTEQAKKVDIEIADDNLEARTKFVDVKGKITNFEIAPDGNRALFGARGDVFTVPAEKGNIRNLTKTSGLHERGSVWSPDGKWIAFLSDKTGEFEIYIIKPDGTEMTQLTSDSKSYRYGLKWSPDSKKILSSDKTMRLYYIDIESKKVTDVTKSDYWEITDFSWSPDSKWIAYSDAFSKNNFGVIYLYSLANSKSYQITDEFYNSGEPVFSPDGKYLFFTSNRDFKPTLGNFELGYTYNNMTEIFGITLQDTLQSPFKFESDEVKVKEDAKTDEEKDTDKKSKSKKSDAKDEIKVIKIDLDGLKNRIFQLPLPGANYWHLAPVDGKLYYVQDVEGKQPSLKSYDFKDKEENDVGDFSGYEISNDGKKILFESQGSYYLTSLKEKVKPDPKNKLNLNDMKVELNRKEEWTQIFNEVWRQMRDFFYDPNMHGVDWKAMHDLYAEELPYVTHRTDLSYLLSELTSELNAGHAYVGGGDMSSVDKVPIGLLGAELEFDSKSGMYKFEKIYEGRNWDEETRSPLKDPGIEVKNGDYLISIDGIKLDEGINPFKILLNKANKYVSIKTNSKPSEDGAKEYNIKTISSEKGLVYYNWVEENRRKVDSMTNGRVGYLQIPDMSLQGLSEFVKYFYPQTKKEGLIIDDRYNGGGFVSSMIIERLRRIMTMAAIARNQKYADAYPDGVFNGPMVCLLNEISASDGDMFPYQFKKAGLGTLIGKRSWGGVVGIRGSLPLLDGGYLYKPEFSHFSTEGDWILEGVGMTPDIEVDNDPGLEYQGIDQQLNKAVEVVMDEIKKGTKPKIPAPPKFPNKK